MKAASSRHCHVSSQLHCHSPSLAAEIGARESERKKTKPYMVYFSCNYNELTFPWLRFLTPSDISEPIKETKKRPGKQDKWRKDSSPQTPHLAISRLLGAGSPAVRNPARAGCWRVTASLWGESLAASTWAEPAFLPGGWRECRGEGLF